MAGAPAAEATPANEPMEVIIPAWMNLRREVYVVISFLRWKRISYEMNCIPDWYVRTLTDINKRSNKDPRKKRGTTLLKTNFAANR